MSSTMTLAEMSNINVLTLRTYFQYTSPLLIFLVYLVAFLIYSITKAPAQEDDSQFQNRRSESKASLSTFFKTTQSKEKPVAARFSPLQKTVFLSLSIGLALSFLANAAIVVLHACIKRSEHWWCGRSYVVYVVASFFVYVLMAISLVDVETSPHVYHILAWSVGLTVEICLLLATASYYISKHHEPQAGDPFGGILRTHVTAWETTELIVDLLRTMSLFALLALYAALVLPQQKDLKAQRSIHDSPEATTPLLNGHGHQNGNSHEAQYGSVDSNASQPVKQAKWERSEKIPQKSWWEYVRSYALVAPYLWPSKSRRLQISLLLCCLLVALARVVNLVVPIEVGRITNILSGENGPHGIPYIDILIFGVLRILQGKSGLIAIWREYLWIPIAQYSYREITTASFDHVHSLSLDFHSTKKTGEVISALNKGSSLNTFLKEVTFSFIPLVIDLIIAVGYFFVEFDIYYSLVVGIMACTYVYVTIRMTRSRSDLKRLMSNLDRTAEAVKNDSITSYETVKYFNAESYELDRYRTAVDEYLEAEYVNQTSLNVLNMTQNLCFVLSLMITCFIAAFQVTNGQRKVGQFVALLTYMAQLQNPLNVLGTFWRQIQNSMINAERMLELLKEKPTVVDRPNAKDLVNCAGEISFNDVQFSYDPRKKALSGLSFTCPPGTTTALVGESGGGKSTVFKLMFRFYDIEGGCIQIDGNNVEDITIESLRRHMGIVPQDPILFNETLMYNLKYANQNATDEEVFEACRAASIHDQILSFPDGYQAKVGERGVKLSGGEKQRIAIARTLLKNPRIILLDEATAALDTETEQHIEVALNELSNQRTTLIIAHRLSTITTADQIIVIHGGQVVEKGTHEELLAADGRYSLMWQKQIRAEKALQLARQAEERANRLRNKAELQLHASHGSLTQSDDDGGVGISGVQSPDEPITPAEGLAVETSSPINLSNGFLADAEDPTAPAQNPLGQA